MIFILLIHSAISVFTYIIITSNSIINNSDLLIFISLSILALPIYYLLSREKRDQTQNKSIIKTSIFWFFVFFFVCFYHFRAIYSIYNKDYKLIDSLYSAGDQNYFILLSILFFTLSLNLFVLVGINTKRQTFLVKYLEKLLSSIFKQANLNSENNNPNLGRFYARQNIKITFWILMQGTSFSLIYLLSKLAGGRLTEFTDNAYLYLFPVATYGVDLYVFSNLFSIKTKNRRNKLSIICLSLVMIIMKSIIMRQLSSFRSVALCLLISIVIGLICKSLNNLFLIIFYLFIIPLITFLGQTRYDTANEFSDSFENLISSDFFTDYFKSIFLSFSSNGDYTAFDVFVSVLSHKQEFYPFGLSFLYIPFHLIPRFIWSNKPIAGSLTDDSFNLAFQAGKFVSIPYTPGIVGQYYLEGGIFFMFILIALTAYFCRSLDYAFENAFKNNEATNPSFIYGLFFFYTSHYIRLIPYQYFYGIFIILLGYYFSKKIDFLSASK